MALSILIFALTGSALLSAVTHGIGFLPQIVGVALLGTMPDRVRPRRLIATGYVLEVVTAAVLGLTHLPVSASLAIVAVVACLTPVFGGAANRVVAEVLTGDAYVLGRSLSNMASSGAQLLGLAGGGLAVAVLGPRQPGRARGGAAPTGVRDDQGLGAGDGCYSPACRSECWPATSSWVGSSTPPPANGSSCR